MGAEIAFLAVLVAACAAGLAHGEHAPPRVAIVGSGISGASAAYFLAQTRPNAEVVVFERDSEVGGRSRTSSWRGGVLIDEGATSVSTLNTYLVGWMREFNISRTSPPRRELGIWDGRAFRFRADDASRLFLARVLWRYGMSPLRLRNILRDTVSNLTAVYELQSAGAAFDSPAQLLRALGLFSATQSTAASCLKREGVSERFVTEFVDGASRCNYLQSSAELSSFVNLVSLAGAALEGSVFRVEGGTSRLTGAVLRASRARVRTGVEVVAIERAQGEAQFRLRVRASGGRGRGAARPSGEGSAGGEEEEHEEWRARAQEEVERFDAVVIAAPLEASRLSIVVHGSAPVVRSRPYVQTHATFVEAASLSSSYFGQSAAAAVGEVLTVDNGSIPFHSIGLTALLPPSPSPPASAPALSPAAGLRGALAATSDSRALPPRTLAAPRGAGQRGVWKVFSKAALADTELDSLFDARGDVRRVVWAAPGAYPVLSPTAESEWPPFRLAPGLAYSGAMESPVSCMETQAISGRNAALLVEAVLPPPSRARGASYAGAAAARATTPSPIAMTQ